MKDAAARLAVLRAQGEGFEKVGSLLLELVSLQEVLLEDARSQLPQKMAKGKRKVLENYLKSYEGVLSRYPGVVYNDNFRIGDAAPR